MWWIDEQDAVGSPGGGSSAGAPNFVEAGDSLPDAALTAHDGEEISLADLAGKQPLVLFFYPKANTSG